MTDRDDMAREMAELAGIRLGYRDAFGRTVETPIESVRRLLAAIGFPSESDSETEDSIARLRAWRDRPVPHVVVVESSKASEFPSHSPDAGWAVEQEDGETVEGRAGQDGRIAFPPLAAGYHRLTLRDAAGEWDATVIAAPPRCWKPAGRKQRWGLSGAVYGLRAEADFGIGDFGGVGAIAEAAAARGASFIGLSPLHALFPIDRGRISPYSPSSRLFVDPIYIDPTQVPGFGPSLVDLRPLDIDAGQDAHRFVNYTAAWAAKRPIFESIWRNFAESGDAAAFAAFRSERGEALELHALFDALTEIDPIGRPGGGVPCPSDAGERRRLLAAHGERVSFYAWLQWIADRQLDRAASRARAAGMEIGLLADLAVGASPDGSELWSGADRFLSALSIGAPPDLLAPQGQQWGLRTFSPFDLERTGMKAFRDLAAATMRHCGAVRIDHVFQLRRLFLVPEGLAASEGAYLRYPTEAMLAVLRVESHRAGCMVVGEDLGTKPPDFPETLHSSGVLGYRVIYFERNADNDFLAPDAYDPETMAVINTHDLATFGGWWRGQDIADRLKYGVVDPDRAEIAVAERELDRERLVALLAREGLIAPGEIPAAAPTEAVVRLLARCRSELVGLSLDDVAGEMDQQNVPGVTDGPPNWRRRLPQTVAELAQAGGPLDRFARAMAAEGRGTPRHDKPQ